MTNFEKEHLLAEKLRGPRMLTCAAAWCMVIVILLALLCGWAWLI